LTKALGKLDLEKEFVRILVLNQGEKSRNRKYNLIRNNLDIMSCASGLIETAIYPA
jgi:hypothetical protein